MRPDITLIFPSSPFLLDEKVFPPLGIMYLSAYLKKCGFSVQCIDLASEELDVQADIVGISFTTPQRNEAFRLAQILKKRKTLIAGGPHPTFMKRECLERGFDYVIEGAGEIKLARLLRSLTGKRIKFIPINDPDEIPFPDRDCIDLKNYKYFLNGAETTPILTSRGCPYRCAFCSKMPFKVKFQSPKRIAEEIFLVEKKYGYRSFMIFDDIFILKEKRLEDLYSILGSSYQFRCFVRADLVNERICEILRKLGVVEVGIGIESGSDKILKINRKGTTSIQNSLAVKILHSFGIRVKAFIIIGLPGETEETVEETREWLLRNPVEDVDITIFQPYPGSAIFANPETFGVKFSYDGNSWYKGRPGFYKSSCDTKTLSRNRITELRDKLELEFKKFSSGS